jgi:hypothetical protein
VTSKSDFLLFGLNIITVGFTVIGDGCSFGTPFRNGVPLLRSLDSSAYLMDCLIEGSFSMDCMLSKKS